MGTKNTSVFVSTVGVDFVIEPSTGGENVECTKKRRFPCVIVSHQMRNVFHGMEKSVSRLTLARHRVQNVKASPSFMRQRRKWTSFDRVRHDKRKGSNRHIQINDVMTGWMIEFPITLIGGHSTFVWHILERNVSLLPVLWVAFQYTQYPLPPPRPPVFAHWTKIICILPVIALFSPSHTAYVLLPFLSTYRSRCSTYNRKTWICQYSGWPRSVEELFIWFS